MIGQDNIKQEFYLERGVLKIHQKFFVCLYGESTVRNTSGIFPTR
jgi:hypothetical protein